MANLTLYPATLQWAVEESDADPAALSQRRGLGQLPNWLESKEPVSVSFNKVEQLSRALHVPFGALVRSVVPQRRLEPLVQYRTVGNTSVQPSKNLQDTIDQMRFRQEWARDELLESGLDANPLVGSVRDAEQDDSLADALRSTLGFDGRSAWEGGNSSDRFRQLKERASDAGIMIMLNSQVGSTRSRKLDLQEFRGFVLIDDMAPLVFINRNDSFDGMIFTLIHEVGHVLLGTQELFDGIGGQGDRKATERAINRAVVKAVIGDEYFRRLWQEKLDAGKVPADAAESIADDFHLSALAMGIQARQFGLADEDTLKELRARMERQLQNKTAHRQEQKTQGNGNRTNASRVDTGFVRLVNAAMDGGRLAPTEGFDLVGVRSSQSYQGLIREKKLI
ncbi:MULTISPECIES: ImmA/IrrE family metallo-endopeptidase [Bifidobacterium]|uniref:ImmA/IrrE family metallo-endopeptidase n=1 Tax=Bifidobacterium apousia TaxID=2750996 RepID=A0A556R1P8_9BIFI|nr:MULTISPECIES: ImmA/IrrE family metallo-endopeptidase [Bifidobacterium]MBI0136862.1 ImmA/IrrE family metallo-endopeptidase [Bifidobacterium sp. W8120]TSJ82828.1 ImmA/IrrE family metallo-endopeptidase [Bifidobacterium apousia]